MSLDLIFWKESSREPLETVALITDEEYEHLTVSPRVIFFRVALLRAWPEMQDMIEPFEGDLELDPADLSRYVLLTLPWSYSDRVGAIVELAREYELVGYDPQHESVIGD